MIKDITEMLKMILIIFLWVAGYSLSLEVIKAYAHINAECKIEVPDSTIGNAETSYAINAKGKL